MPKREAILVDLKEAEQIIFISYGFHIAERLAKYFKSDVLIKCIFEHEEPSSRNSQYFKQVIGRSLGLSENCYGIKLSKQKLMSRQDAFGFLEKNANKLTSCLFKYSKTANLNDFDKANVLLLAYFSNSKKMNFLSFLNLFVINQSLFQDKILWVYLSSKNVNAIARWLKINIEEEFEEIANDLYLGKIIFISGAGRITEVVLSNKYVSKINILYGFDLNDDCYNVLYRCVSFAGISGDNTFENAVSAETPFYYCSTNFKKKMPGFKAISNIVTNKLIISPEVKKQLLLYLEVEPFFTFSNGSSDVKKVKEITERFRQLDLIAVAEGLRQLCVYLKSNHNFYDHLERIFLENISVIPAAKEVAICIPGTIFHHKEAQQSSELATDIANHPVDSKINERIISEFVP